MLTRWDPFVDFARLSRDLFEAPETNGAPRFVPPVDVTETQDAFVVRAELPGLKPEDVKIDLDKNVLTLSGERKLEKKEDKSGAREGAPGGRFGYRRIERRYGAFSRSFVLPETVRDDGIEATMADGVLTVKIPKQPVAQPRKIEVKAS